MTLKEANCCGPQPRSSQFSRTWRVQGLDSQGQGLQKLSFEDVLEAATSGYKLVILEIFCFYSLYLD